MQETDRFGLWKPVYLGNEVYVTELRNRMADEESD